MRGSHVARRTASLTLRTLSSRRPHPPAGMPTGRPNRLARGRAPVTTRALFGKKPPASPSPSENASVSVRELTETCRRAIKTYGYDDAETLAVKYALRDEYGLGGLGIWTAAGASDA